MESDKLIKITGEAIMKTLLAIIAIAWLFYGTITGILIVVSPHVELLGGVQTVILGWTGFYLIPALIMFGVVSAIDAGAMDVK